MEETRLSTARFLGQIMELPSTAISRRIDPVLTWIGQSISWIWLLLLITIVCNVVLRYVFGEGRIELEEMQWHLYSTGFLLGIGYTFQVDGHVRVDVVHERLGPRWQAWLELYGILLCVLPFVALILIYSVPFIQTSFTLGEVSMSPGGLPFRWAIKSMLFIGFFLLLLAAISRLSRVWAYLFRSWP
ncbi:MAG: TRAP transporter small permease subunit [Pseudomonadales bacterium]|nr:TRAP transporter small permease subunit [Pseudomonadales bacterium]MBO6821505.1 TRAP transporter small permease subunit [Pseudomonadales bacterium]